MAIDGTCYFKSTDGHCNNWSFSGTRLNVHVAETAARRGGCVIVDATRSTTKRFPDSLSKTIPIWAETLNRAVREARRRGEEADEDAATKKNQTNAWDDDAAHSGAAFPPWIGERERDAIRELLPSFRERLRAVSPDLSRLVRTLQAPLRCVWVSRETAALDRVLRFRATREGFFARRNYVLPDGRSYVAVPASRDYASVS